MRVLLVSTTFYPSPPPSYGGTEAVVWHLAEELNKMGHKVSVAAPIGSKFSEGIDHIPTVQPLFGQMQEDGAWAGVQAHIIDPGTNRPTEKFDVIHENSFRMYSYNVAKDHPSVKVCATVHWQMHWPSVGAGPPPVSKPNLIALSQAHAMACSALLGVHFEFVHNGIPVEAFPFQKEKGERFLFLGRIARFKGPHEAIRLADKHRLPLDVAGEDRFVSDPQYVHQVMNACRGFARYHGEVPQDKKLELLKNARAVILPYMWAEPFGIVPIEANACGTPAIGLDYSGSAMAEIIQDGVNGFLCKSVDEMGEAAANVGEIEPEECRRVVEERFTARLQAERYVRLYEQILDGKGW